MNALSIQALLQELKIYTFVTDGDFSQKDMKDMAEAWVNIEDDKGVVNAVIDDELQSLEQLDTSKTTATDDNKCDDDDEEEVVLVGSAKKKYTHQDIVGDFDIIQ